MKMKKALKKVLTLVEEHPDGIHLEKIAAFYKEKYQKKLSLSSLGFTSMASLVASRDELVVVGELVFHKAHVQGQAEAGASTNGAEDSRKTEEVLQNIVEIVKRQPNGIPLKKLAVVYKQTYHQTLTLTFLGFQTIASIVEALSDDLVVEGQQVFHKSHRPPNQPGAGKLPTHEIAAGGRPKTPQTTESRIQNGDSIPSVPVPRVDTSNPLMGISFGPPWRATSPSPSSSFVGNPVVIPSQPAEKLTQSQLLERVTEKKPEREQQQQAGGIFNHSEFPALGSNVAPTRGQKHTAPQTDGSPSIFRDAYHTQLRQMHGENVRAAEVLDQNDPMGQRRHVNLDLDEVNSLAEDVIRDIAAQGDLVTKEKVMSRVCSLMQISAKEADRLKSWKIQALKDLQYTMREINMFIECTEAVVSICTLYELGQALAALKDKKRYEELNLGPLCKLPLVHRLFKIDGKTKDDDIHQIETVDILRQLRLFRHKCKGTVDLAEFMKHLADHYNCNSPYELGIRITSIGLAIGTIGKVSRGQNDIMFQAREAMQRDLEEEIRERMRKLKKSLMEPFQGAGSFSSAESMALRNSYTSMTAAEAVLAVFTNAEGVFSPRMAKHVQSFLLQVSGDRLATALFQLAICGGSLEVPNDLVPKNKPSNNVQMTKTEDKPTTALPSEDAVKQFLKGSLSSHTSAITLGYIAALERKLAKQFQVKDFISLQQGSFLEFLVKHIQLLQETVGCTVNLGSVTEGSGFRPTRQDVFEFIKQCGDATSADLDPLFHIESALRSHYRVQDSRDLCLGSLRMLASFVQRQREMPAGAKLSEVYYESALFANHSSPPVNKAEGACDSVGLLGQMDKDKALASLLSCPLLEDLCEWSQWDLIFKPCHGALKDFIERNAANTGLAALEVSPGVLLRITTNTGDKLFSCAAMNLDPIGTAGHLVSMVVTNGIANAPLALLANHMETSLAAAMAKENLCHTEEDMSCYNTVARFLLACFTRIPARTCQLLLQQVFLEPFSRALGQAKSKQVLLTVAQSDLKYLNCVHRLGLVLGITEWGKDYEKIMTQPQSQTEQRHTPPLDYAKSNLMDSESSSASALSEYGDLDLEDNSDHADQSLQQVDGDQGDAEEEDDEEFYELSCVPQGELPSVDTDGTRGDEQSEMTDSNETDSFIGQSEDPLSVQRSIIEDIRKNEFGIGVELTAETQKLMEVHQERLGRSLDRLSTELYSKDTHFVLELIQNADDNSYPVDTGFVPSLAFVVERDCITILNNETGFQEKNIRAICDVGRSTKGKHKYGYIGQKGIGFKSVFKVTDCPGIHSNGFHLHFDKTCGPMGYILPHWTEDERPLDAQLSDITEQSWTTKICLPLRAECHQTRNLFHDVHPSLLLFLHRLRSITIYSQSEKRLMAMTRKDLSHNVLEVEHTEGRERWLVVRSTLHPPKIKEDVESTELALAFQLGSDTTGSDIVCQPQKQPVFAFLPLRSFGFRFIVQGDFDIPSSREDVDRDSSWNQWLRSEIPQLFLQAMDVFTNHPEFSGLKGLCHFLQFVPLPDEVLDFFKPVAGQIIQLLKGKAFLPTLGSDGKVVYKLPSQVAICQDAVIRNVIGVDELDRHLSLSYLHPSLHPAPPAPLLRHLGVRYLKGPDVTTVTTAMAKELMRVEGIHSDAGLRQLARLLVCNFRALEHGYGEEESILQALRDLPIIPLADGRVVALSQEEVFFPMEETKSQKKAGKSQNGPLSALYKDINVVHPSLLSCVSSLEGHQVRELLKRLGVHELEPQELLEKHIYPSIRNDKWKSKPESVVVSYLVFMKQHTSSSQEYVDTVPVLTSRGLLCPSQDRVHFSEEYGNINLPEKLPGCDWVLLSPCYLQTDGDLDGWKSLFSHLGVREGLIIRKERRTLTAEELASSPWSAESATWQQNPEEGGCVLEDYPCEEFHALATARLPDSVLSEQRRTLLRLLATNWDTGYRYSQYLTAHVIDRDGRPIRSTRSSFHHFMCHLEWVPAYRPLEGGAQETKYLCPNSVYLASPEVTELLGTHVYYVNMQPSEFSRALGMRHSITVESLIQYLKEWGVKHEGDTRERGLVEHESKRSNFTSTVQHIHNVYTYLHKNCSQGVLKDLFQHTPVVFIVHSRRDDGWCSGRFHLLKEVCWSEPTALFHRYKMLTEQPDSSVQQPRILAPFYGPLDGMRDFFNRLLNVEPSPNMKQYVSLLEMICSSAPIPTADVLQDVSVIYATLAHKCKIQLHGDRENIPSQALLNSAYCSTLKGMVSDKRVFPTKDNNWVTLGSRPMISDSKELDKIFKPHKQFYLLNLPPPAKKTVHKTAGQSAAAERSNSAPVFREQDRALFLEEICGIRRLSQCVRTDPQTENLRPCPAMQAMVHSLMPYIQRFLYHHDKMADVYSELLDNSIGEKIKRLNFRQVGKLYIRYELDVADGEDAVVEMQDVICLLKDKKELYIQKDHLSAKLDICRELVTLFCTEEHHKKELMQFLSGLITSLSDSGALKRFLQKEDIRELPSEEEQWEVPEPKQEVYLERALSSGQGYTSSVKEPPTPAQMDGEETLACWPPRASIQTTGVSRSGRAEGGAVEAVMKLWPPPAGPKDRDPETAVAPSPVDALGDGRQKAITHPVQPNPPAVTKNPQPSESLRHHIQKEPNSAEGGQKNLRAPNPTQNPPPAHHAQTNDNQPALNDHSVVPTATVIPSRKQESEDPEDAQRPPMNLDIPFWNKAESPEATLEDITLTCQRPTTVVLHDDHRDVLEIGTWGEQLVNSFLCQWRDSKDPGRPTHVLWCNQNGETGEPYDFRLTFGGADGEQSSVYVEVKATVKKEKAFIHLSLNELNFALKKRECYHIFRVYCAGDGKNVRLCRIQNVEQHLRTKNLELYLFI